MIPEALLEHYKRMIKKAPPPNYVDRKLVYDNLRALLPDSWEARNSRQIKETLDAIDREVVGRDTSGDWLKSHER